MAQSFLNYGIMIVIGMVLGAVFFGGLWITVRRMSTSKSPGLLFMSSVLIRTTIVLLGIWYFSSGDARAMAACLLGFVGIRLLATHGAVGFVSHFEGKKTR